MKAAIRAFGSMKRAQENGRKILVMGDMLELGDYSHQAHYEAGRCAAQEDIDIIFCFGEQSLAASQGAREACNGNCGKDIRYFTDKEEMTQSLLALVQKGDTLWFKASRGIKLEEVLSRLYERF